MSIYAPSTRQELIDYCLRALGEPTIEINVDPDQVEDRFEEALQYFREFHHDASERIYLSARISPSILNLQSGTGNTFVVGEVIIGANASCKVHQLVSDNVIYVKNVTGTFVADETVTSSSAASAQLASADVVTLGSFDNKYFDIDERILSITKVLDVSSTGNSGNPFDIQYQFMLNSMPTLTSFDMGYYAQLMSYLELLNDMLNSKKPVRYKRHTNRLYIDWNWANATIGDYVVVEAFAVIDPVEFTDVYNDLWIKKYLTALIKRQWGLNLKKFVGVQLPGGVQLDGQTIYNEALMDIEKLEKECQDNFGEPIDFFLG